MKRSFVIPAVTLSLVLVTSWGCSASSGSSGNSSSSSTEPVVDASGKKIYKVDPATGATLSASGINSSDPSFAKAGVVIPPGALSVPVDISIFQAQSLVNGSNQSSLGVSGLTAAGPAVAVLPSQSVTISGSLQIAVPFSALTGLTGDENLCVLGLYPGESKNEIETFSGSELTIGDGIVKLSIKRFGAFQAAYTSEPCGKKTAETSQEITQSSANDTGSTGDDSEPTGDDSEPTGDDSEPTGDDSEPTGGDSGSTGGDSGTSGSGGSSGGSTFNLADELAKIKGVWSAGCSVEDSSTDQYGHTINFSTRTLFKFNGTDFSTTTFSYFGPGFCEEREAYKTSESSGSIILTQADANTTSANKIDITLTSDVTIPKSEGAVSDLSSSDETHAGSVCGASFSIGAPTTLTPQLCADDDRGPGFGTFYTIIKVEDGRLKLGADEGELNGSTEATRHSTLIPFGLLKIASIENGNEVPTSQLAGGWKSACIIGDSYNYVRSVRFVDGAYIRTERRYDASFDTECQYGHTLEFQEIGHYAANETTSPRTIDFVGEKIFLTVFNDQLLSSFNLADTAFCGGGFTLGVTKEINTADCSENESRQPKLAYFDIFNIDSVGKLSFGLPNGTNDGSADTARPSGLDPSPFDRMTDLEGGYTSMCIMGQDGYAHININIFSGSTFKTIDQLFTDSTCSSAMVASAVYKGSFSTSSINHSFSALNTNIDSIDIWVPQNPTDGNATSSAFQAICPQGTLAGESMLLTPADCGLSSLQFDSFRLGGETLTLAQLIGRATIDGLGSSSESRPANFEYSTNFMWGVPTKNVAPDGGGVGDNGGGTGNSGGGSAFTITGPESIPLGGCQQYYITTSTTSNSSINFTPGLYNLSGAFYSDSSCHTKLTSGNYVTLQPGSISQSFYFMPSGTGVGKVKMTNTENGVDTSIDVSVTTLN